jgi:ADP-heptose:LPS heptosyltransferase
MWAVRGLDNGDYLTSWIRRRFEGGPKIVVLGVGSIGDVLQITPLLRALRGKFPRADISLLHGSRLAETVLQGNPNLDSVTRADAPHFKQVKKAVRDEGAADLVVDVEGISCVVTYTLAPPALRHPDLSAACPESFFAAAASAREFWKRHHPVVSRRESRCAAQARDVHYLNVMGATANLPIGRDSALDFFTEPTDTVAINRVTSEGPYVTVQNGVDSEVMRWSHALARRPTKLLPPPVLKEAVRLIRAASLAVIQLGTKDDEPIEGIDIDLRGSTSLREAAVILKRAVCHVGIEGGLVHLARAAGIRSVVAFGPTSAAFLGYPQNINLVASDCNNCWWTTCDWYLYCPRGLPQPECMTAYRPDIIAAAVLDIFKGGPGIVAKGNLAEASS